MVNEIIPIPTQDSASLRDVGRVLRSGPTKVVGPKGEVAVLPDSLHELLRGIVKGMSSGQSLVLMSEEKKLTTQQAGELLGMSRPYLIRLLDAGEIPYILVGKHRRVALRDVLVYGKRRRTALDQMSRDAYDAGLYENSTIPEGGQDE